MGVGDDHPGADSLTPPVPRPTLVLDPEVATGPQHDRRSTGRPRRRAEAGALPQVDEPVVADRRMLGFGCPQVLLHGDRQALEVGQPRDVPGSRHAGLVQLAGEEGNRSLEDPPDHVP